MPIDATHPALESLSTTEWLDVVLADEMPAPDRLQHFFTKCDNTYVRRMVCRDALRDKVVRRDAADREREAARLVAGRIREVYELRHRQRENSHVSASEYVRGIFHGLETALAIILGRAPDFSED